MIRKEGNKWVIYSKDGAKVLGRFDSKTAAEERENQIQKIKHAKQGNTKMAVTANTEGLSTKQFVVSSVNKDIKHISESDLSEIPRETLDIVSKNIKMLKEKNLDGIDSDGLDAAEKKINEELKKRENEDNTDTNEENSSEDIEEEDASQ